MQDGQITAPVWYPLGWPQLPVPMLTPPTAPNNSDLLELAAALEQAGLDLVLDTRQALPMLDTLAQRLGLP